MPFCFYTRFRPVKGKQEDWKAIVENFRKKQDYEATYRGLISGDSLRTFFLTKSKPQQNIFKEHVSIMYLLTPCIQ